MGVRVYNPATGRFLQVDPVYGGNANAYTYPNDPLTVFDLDGRWGCGWCKKAARVAHRVMSNSVFQAVVTVAACSTGWGCGAALYGFAAYNSATRFKKHGFTKRTVASSVLDFGLAAISARTIRKVPRGATVDMVRRNGLSSGVSYTARRRDTYKSIAGPVAWNSGVASLGLLKARMMHD